MRLDMTRAMGGLRGAAVFTTALLAAASLPAVAGASGALRGNGSAGAVAVKVAADVPAVRRDGLLGRAWRSSSDRAWTTAGDATGFHVLTAEARNGYAWHTVATLAEPGFETDRWIGNACLTASGRRVVVVYAPRGFTNTPELSERGGFTAVVDLDTAKGASPFEGAVVG